MQLRFFLLIGFLALAIFAVAADDPPPQFEAEKRNGDTVKGALQNATIRLKTPYGTQDIEARVIQRLTFTPRDTPGGRDVVELMDGERTRGQVVTDPIVIGTTSVSPSEVREMRTLREEKVGLLAIVIALLTLSAMEIVLGIDNIIFLSILAGKLPEEQQPRARRLGLFFALATRILLLLSLSWMLSLTDPIFIIPDLPYFHDPEAREVSWRDVILLAGGLFLIYKSVKEMHEKLEQARSDRLETARAIGALNGPDGGASSQAPRPTKVPSFASVLIQIAILDIVFSLDSVITAVGMVDQVWVMIVAMVIAMGVMLLSAKGIGDFVQRHPTIKVLALAFLILIGVMLVAESLGQHIDKGYIYFAMAFAVVMEMINLRLRKKPAEPSAEKVTV
jgi:predicted tellurium resistance membrane protein TerC